MQIKPGISSWLPGGGAPYQGWMEASTLDAMNVALDLPERVAERLRAEARRRGMTVEELIAELSEDFPAGNGARETELGFIGMGTSTSGKTSDDIDEMLAEGFGT